MDPLTRLLEHSDRTLQEIMLMRENRAAEVKKLLRDLIDEAIDHHVEAALCRFVMANRSRIRSTNFVQEVLDFGGDAISPPRAVPKAAVKRRNRNAA